MGVWVPHCHQRSDGRVGGVQDDSGAPLVADPRSARPNLVV